MNININEKDNDYYEYIMYSYSYRDEWNRQYPIILCTTNLMNITIDEWGNAWLEIISVWVILWTYLLIEKPLIVINILYQTNHIMANYFINVWLFDV